jgi:hypothetical protein
MRRRSHHHWAATNTWICGQDHDTERSEDQRKTADGLAVGVLHNLTASERAQINSDDENGL